jgi:DNA-binding MarR family transcriptional regulator
MALLLQHPSAPAARRYGYAFASPSVSRYSLSNSPSDRACSARAIETDAGRKHVCCVSTTVLIAKLAKYVNMADLILRLSDRGTKTEHGARGEPIWDIIELLFFAYRDFTGDADEVLATLGFGRAHHRVLHFVNRQPGLKVAELLDILKITKQSLGRVLRQLIEQGYVIQKEGASDRRQRLLYVTPRGEGLAMKLASLQTARIARALADLGPNAHATACRFLAAMIGPDHHDYVLRFIAQADQARRSRG